MQNVKRYFIPGYYYFTTHTTYLRKPILVDHFPILWDAILSTKKEYNFELIAWVVLPNHMHLLVNPLDSCLPSLFRKIKLKFAKRYNYINGIKKGRVWHNRYHDHVIRDNEDLNNHINYIHYNPIKHGLTGSINNYIFSSIHDYYNNRQ